MQRSTFLPLFTCCALVAGCTADAEDVRPPRDELFFPTGIAVAESAGVAFITNGNSDLRWDSGTISVLDLDRVDAVFEAWRSRQEIPAGDQNSDGDVDCTQDADRTETLICDEFLFVRADAGVRIGNFATEIGVQGLDGNALRLVVPTRGDPSVTWADWNGDRLTCTAGGEPFSLCDEDHRLAFVMNDADKPGLPDEPFGVYADTAGEFAMITHLSNGAVTLIDSPRQGTVQITDVLTGIFAASSSTGRASSTAIAGRLANAPGNIVYVGSRSEDRIQTFTVGRPVNDAPPYLLPGAWFFLDAAGAYSGGSADTRDMTFSADGSRLYLVNRTPPTLQVYDTSIGPTGVPRNTPVGVTDICRQASTVAISGSGDTERAYVTCFQDGQVFAIDPRGRVSVEDIILVGRGPYAVAAAGARNKLFVTNFLEDTIAVIDIEPGSPTRNRVVLKIGKARAL
jgi:DNA-binding beta-propeller fold protein YncE